MRLLSPVNLFIIRGRNKGRGGASVIIIQIFSFARARRINIYNAFLPTIPPAKGTDREKSSRFEQTFSPFLSEAMIWGKTLRSKDILIQVHFNEYRYDDDEK